MSVLSYDEKNTALSYMLLKEAAQLEAERRAKEAQTDVRYSYSQSSEPKSRLSGKIEHLRDENLPDLFQVENRDRLWVILKNCAIGMVACYIGYYLAQSSKTN